MQPGPPKGGTWECDWRGIPGHPGPNGLLDSPKESWVRCVSTAADRQYTATTNVNIGTKKPNASEKVLGTGRGNVSGAKRVTQVQDGEFREMISNLMEPSHPYLLPRTVPTSAGVIFHKPQMSIIKNLETEPHGVMIIRPNVENTVSLSTLFEGGPLDPEPSEIPPSEGFKLKTRTLSVNMDLKKHDGVKVPTRTMSSTAQYFLPDGGVATGQLIYERVSFPNLSKLIVYAYGNIADGTEVTLNFRRSNPGATVFTDIIAPVMAVAAAGRVAFNVTLPLMAISDVSLYLQAASELTWEQTLTQVVGFSVEGGSSMVTTSLWDMLGNVQGATTSQMQYYAAERYSITGFSALLRNTTASQYKSGSVVAAQVPGGSAHLIPSDPVEAYNFVASYNDPKTYSGQLNKGIHWFFTPEKVQDWFFKPTSDPEGERPFLVIAWSGVATNDLANKLGLTLDIRTNIELLTTDISLMKFMPTADLSRLMDLYITLVSAHNSVGENPDHKNKIRTIVNSIVKNPYVTTGLKMMRETGKVVLPLVLAAL